MTSLNKHQQQNKQEKITLKTQKKQNYLKHHDKHADTKQTTRMHTMIIMIENDAEYTITFQIKQKLYKEILRNITVIFEKTIKQAIA